PVLGDMADTAPEDPARRGRRDVPARDMDASGRHLPKAGDRLDELGLTVALDAGDTHDLTGPYLERYGFDDEVAAIIPDGQLLEVKDRRPGMGRALLHLKLNGPAYHHGRQLSFACLIGTDRSHDLAPTKDRDPVRHCQDL